MYTDAPNKRCSYWSNNVLQLRMKLGRGPVDRPGGVTNLVETRAIFLGKIIVPENNTL